MKKLAIFDIDGVIYEGHSIFDLIRYQESTGFIKKGLWDYVQLLLEKYKKGKSNYKEIADAMLLAYSESLIDKKYIDIVAENTIFIQNNQDKILPYFSKLSLELQKTHDLYFVSTNFDFTVEAFSNIFKVYGFLSSKIKQEDGVVIGGIEISLGGNKGIVKDLIDKYGKSGSIAIGDSENDVDMLDLVEFPIAMEPNKKMEAIALGKNWKIVNRDTITDIIISHAK